MNKISFAVLATSLLLCCASPVQEVRKVTRNLPKYSDDTAGELDFDIRNLTYVKDKFEPLATAAGDRYYYNSLELWTAIYSSHNQISNTKYYYVLVRAVMNTNSDKLQDGYYRIVSKELKITIESNLYSNLYSNPSNFRLLKYSPETYGGSSTSTTIGYNVGVTDSGYSSGVSYSVTNHQDNVILTPSTSPNGSDVNKRIIDFRYAFKNTANKSINNDSPYRGDFIQSCVAVYQIENYSQVCDNYNINFSINAKATSQKYSVTIFGCNGHETKTSQSIATYNDLSLHL